MIIKEIKNIENNDIVGDFGSTKAGIDESSMPFMFEMLSKNLYSNPIGSIVREITSNCFDSHIEAGVDDPVIIKMSEDEEGEYISFNDFGVGLSPERMNKTYVNYFSSTKRATNDQIGGFGLGSKTPLSYQDYFYINTVFDKKKYSYIFSKGTSVPILDLLTEDEIEDKNGTEIKIYIKNENDRLKFANELASQLCYFDNVYYEDDILENGYKIYELDTFKYRNTYQYNDKMHICLGKVPYPINWEEIGLEEVKIPVGVKFEVGEIVVTPSREALRYTDEVKILVKERVEKCVEEIKELYNKEAKVLEDFHQYWKSRNERPHINLSDEDKLYLTGLGEAKVIYKPFKDAGLDKINEHQIIKMFNYMYLKKGVIKENRYSPDAYIEDVFNRIKVQGTILHSDKADSHKGLTYYSVYRLFRYSTYVYVKSNPFKYLYSLIGGEVGDDYSIKGQTSISRKFIPLGTWKKVYDLYQVLKTITEPLEVSLDIYKPDPSDIEAYKEWRIKNDPSLRRKRDGKIACNHISKNITRSELKLSDIDAYKGIIVYGFRDDTVELSKAISFLGCNKALRDTFKKRRKDKQWRHYDDRELCPEAVQVIQISRTNAHYFKNNKNMTHVSNLYSDNKVFRRVATVFRILKLKNSIGESGVKIIEHINKEIYDLIKECLNWYKEHYKDNMYYSFRNMTEVVDNVLEVAYSKDLFDPSMVHKLQIIDKYFEGAEMLKIASITEENLPIILKYLKEKKKKINLEYYQKYVKDPQLGVQGELNFDGEEETKTKFIVLTKQVA